MNAVSEFNRTNNLDAETFAKLKSLQAFDIVAETDRLGRIIFVNERFCEVTKFSSKELLGRDHRILNSQFHPREFFRQMWSTLVSGRIWTGDVKNRAKDGSTFWVNMIVTPIFDSFGSIEKFLSVQREITHLKEEELAVRDAERHYRELLESVELLCVGLDLNGKITFCNSAVSKILGKSLQELRGWDWFSTYFDEPDRIRLVQLYTETLSEKEHSSPYECAFKIATGEKRTFRFQNTLFRDADDAIAGVTILGEDVTEQRAAEAKVAELREKSERQKEDVMAFVSHELRSPLNSILITVDAIRAKSRGERRFSEPVSLDESLQQIELQCHRIMRVSRDFMDVSLNHADGLSFNFRPTSLNRLIWDVRRSFDHVLNRNPHILLEITSSGSEIIGKWDAARLDQVFCNLFSNAIKYSKPEGGRIQVRFWSEGERVHITVADRGVGIPPDQIDSIFEAFCRGENVSHSTSTGFGLGLKIAKDIIERHKGCIFVKSKLHEGSEFHIELPLVSDGE